jgi:hypothetical protein
MKKTVLLLALTLAAFVPASFAQTHISTSERSDYSWDASKSEWKLVSTDGDEKTFFEINKEYTLMKHTTPGMTSNYIIRSRKEDKTNGWWEFEVTSDVGNKYTMIFDQKKNNVRFIGNSEGRKFLVRHEIKRVWTDD